MAHLKNLVLERENYNLYIVQLIFTLIATALNFFSFVSPYWIEAKSGAQALFTRIGLWTVCFDGYMRPNQYNKAYYGCYYIYYVEYDSIREWLNPIWLYFIQTIASIGLIFHGIVVFFVLCQLSSRVEIENLDIIKFLMTGHFLAGFSILCTLLGFTYGRYDSRWMPYPRFNKLSWSFGVGIISIVFTIASFFTLLVFYLKVHAKQDKYSLHFNGEELEENDEDDDNQEDELKKLSSRVYSAVPSDRIFLRQQPEDEQSSSYTQHFSYKQPGLNDADIVEDLGEDQNNFLIYPHA